jgi:hypothetical protein
MKLNTHVRLVLRLKISRVMPYSSPIPVAARSKGWVCGPSPAQIEGSNLAGDMDVYLL